MKNIIDKNLLRLFVKEHSAPVTDPQALENNGHFGLALVTPEDEPIPGIIGEIQKDLPEARTFKMTAPEGENNLKQFRAFLSELLYLLNEPPLKNGQEPAVATHLARLLSTRFDFMIVDAAERLGTYSLDALRRDHGNPPTFLIARSDRILDTLLSSDSLLQRVTMLA